MPGRHATATQERAPRGRIVTILMVTIVVLAVGAFGVRELIDARANSCDSSPDLDVAADPAMSEVLSDVALDFERDVRESGDDCVEVTVTGTPGAEVAATIGSEDSPSLWIPDSSGWTMRLDDASSVETLGQVATSPLVIVAARATAADLGWPDGEFSWQLLLGADRPGIPDPASTTEGLVGMMAVQASLSDADQLEQVGAMTALSRAIVPSSRDAYASLADDSGPTVFVASEQSVIAHNQATDDDRVVAIYPTEGTFTLDFPILSTGQGGSDEADQLRADFVEYLQSPAAIEQLQAAGFRTPGGEAAESAGIADGTQPGMPETRPAPDPAAVEQFTQLWSALAREMRMLTVIDVSGSMNYEVSSGDTRIEVTRDAALNAVGLLRPTSEVGLWVFSILLDPPDYHHVELAPVARLDEEVGDHTHLEELTGALQSLPGRVEGGTALYDTALAAFRHMQDTYDAERVNSVVLMTDGRDEDNPASIGLERLLSILRDEFDPDKPVPIITIGIGPDADLDALQQISEATGTRSYQAEDANDIDEVFTRAMLERQCRPNC